MLGNVCEVTEGRTLLVITIPTNTVAPPIAQAKESIASLDSLAWAVGGATVLVGMVL